MKVNGHFFVSLFLLFCWALAAQAQTVPEALDPGQLEKSLEKPIELGIPPPSVVPPKSRLQRPKDAESVKFLLKSVRIVGADTLPLSQLTPAYAEQVGKEITLEQLYQLADRVTATYRNAGFVISQAVIPAQTIADGDVEIRVVEGFISDTEFLTSGFESSGALQALGEDIKADKPMSLSRFERNMLLMNDLPGLSAVSAIGRSETGGLGSARVRISASHDPFTGSASINNRGSESTGPGRLELNATRNLTAQAHTAISAGGAFSLDGSELAVGNGSVDIGLGRRGTSRLRLAASIVQSQPEIQLAAFNDLDIESSTISATYSRPFVRSRLENLYFDFGVRAYESTIQGQRASDGTFGTDTETNLRIASIGFRVDEVHAERAVSQFEVRFVKGFNEWGASDRRIGAPVDVNFTKAEFFLSRLQALGGRFSLLVAADAQVALSKGLPSSEVFGIGGQNFVRAYDSSESTAESGVAFKSEVRFDTRLGSTGIRLVPYGYLDYGVLDKDTATSNNDLTAAGLGARFSRGSIGGYLEIGVPIDGDVAAEGNDDPRFFGGLSFNF